MKYKNLWSKNKSRNLIAQGLRQMKRRPFLGLALLGLALYILFAGEGYSPNDVTIPLPEVFTGQVVRVADGDTITVAFNPEKDRVRKVKIRLFGIDAPEKTQDHYKEAKDILTTMLLNQTVQVEIIDTDRYGRVVGRVFLEGQPIDFSLINRGLAWVYLQYCKKSFCWELKEYEKKAREKNIGLWQNPNPLPPWEWRRKNKKNY